jgi:prepilin-type N-terminal cleavage/methylation domain-containing protein
MQMKSSRMRGGFTLIELIVATALAAIVGATLMITLRRQERFYSSATEMMQLRSQLRDAADVLVADIRGAAVSRYGLLLMTDTALELFTTLGTSVLCATPSGRTLFLPPATLSSGAGLTSLLASPDTGDLALVLSLPGGKTDSARWTESRISAFASRSLSNSCPATTGFTSALDAAAGRTGYALTLSAALPPEVRKGAPIRFVRRARYSLYRSSDGAWYLGYRRCNAIGKSVCATIQPVSGPYLAYSRGGTNSSGLAFRYFDTNGNELFDAALSPALAKIDVVLRGETSRAVSLAGDARQRYRDSSVVTVSPRNRVR